MPATTLVGALGTKPGITFTALDDGPLPTTLVAYTVTVIVVLFVNPEIVQPVDEVVHVCPVLAVAV